MNVENKRIGLFIYDWSMYHYIKDLAIKLSETGYAVDVLFKDWDIRPHYADTDDFSLHQNIRFFDFTTKNTRFQVYKRRYTRLLNRIAIPFAIPRNYQPHAIIDRGILDKSIEIIKSSQYACLIGIEKMGLIWAGILSQTCHIPLIYYSLELYIQDNPIFEKVYHLLAAEKKYHQLSVATIIQDEPRADVLFKSNGIEKTNALYFPVSAKGNIVQEKSKFLQNKLHIAADKKIVLYFGGIDNTRFMNQIVNMANEFEDNVVLVVHGIGSRRYVDYLQSIADRNKVIFSLDFIPEGEIVDLISSADIGIALYETTNENDRLVAFSSSKVAYYTQCGIPMIAFDTSSFRELVSNYQCVELITNVSEIPDKVRKILNNYDTYRQQSYSAYQCFYSLDKNFSKLFSKLEPIINGA